MGEGDAEDGWGVVNMYTTCEYEFMGLACCSSN